MLRLGERSGSASVVVMVAGIVGLPSCGRAALNASTPPPTSPEGTSRRGRASSLAVVPVVCVYVGGSRAASQPCAIDKARRVS